MEGKAVRHNIERGPPKTIPVKYALIWFSGSRGEDLNMIVYQNMYNLYNRYKSIERKFSQKNPENRSIYSLSCSCSYNLSSFWFILKQQWTIEEISILVTAAILNGGGAVGHIFERDPPKAHSCQLWCNLIQRFQRKRFKCDLLSKYA